MNDPYVIDADEIKNSETKKPSSASKVNWHQIPDGESMSTWRILPFVKKRTFYVKVTKHWGVPGFKGSVTCPRSFEDPANPGRRYPCAICERFFELLKSKDAADQAFARNVLRQSTSYYANAVSIDHPEKGVGVLNMPYTVFKTLLSWLDVPKFREFSHPVRGRNFIIKATIVPGSQVPGQQKEKRDYSVIPDDPGVIANEEWLQKLYDLDTIVGVPTYEFTQSCLAKLLSGDPNEGQLPEGVPLYHKLLGSSDDVPNQAPPTNIPAPQPVTQPTMTATGDTQQDMFKTGDKPAFAEAGTKTATTPPPTTFAKKAQTQEEVRAMMAAILEKKGK